MKVVEGNTVITSSRQALSTLLIGIAAFTAFQLIALLILVSLLFSAIVQERYREVGLLRAMGAKPNQVMTIILTEAAIITGLGGLAGLGFGAAMLLMFARSLGFYFGLLGCRSPGRRSRFCRSAPCWRSRFRRSSVSSAHFCRRGGRAGWHPTRSFRRKAGDVTFSAQSLTKRYGTASGDEAVRGVSLELQVGDFVSIVGRSGSGKSTLMAMLGALTKPTEGKLLLDGTDVWTLSEAELATFRSRRIGFIFQFPSLLSNLTAVDNVAVPALLGRTMDAGQAYARAYDLLARVGLREGADAYPGSMSGGEQRRVAIARALINSPPLLLADEPTSDLDEDTETDIIDLLEQLQRTESFGFVLVTHNLELARRARRTYEMRQGVLTATDLPQVEGIRNAHGTSDQPRSTRQWNSRCPRAVAPIRLGSSLWRGVQIFLLAGAVIFGGILLADFGVDKYQKMRVREREARSLALQHLALNSLRGDVHRSPTWATGVTN